MPSNFANFASSAKHSRANIFANSNTEQYLYFEPKQEARLANQDIYASQKILEWSDLRERCLVLYQFDPNLLMLRVEGEKRPVVGGLVLLPQPGSIIHNIPILEERALTKTKLFRAWQDLENAW